VYSVLFGRRRRAAPRHGAAYGLAAWAFGYLGWIPALGYSPAAAREPGERNFMMIASHLVWGGVAGWLLEPAGRRRR
jgi:uncharacterized membrane protein YagU involved in acid resistance